MVVRRLCTLKGVLAGLMQRQQRAGMSRHQAAKWIKAPERSARTASCVNQGRPWSQNNLERARRAERVALTEEQVSEYSLPVIVKHDRRYKDGRPHEAVETEALRQTVLIEILRARLNALLTVPLSRVLEREQRQRKRLAALLRKG
jgi:hypothetical protein